MSVTPGMDAVLGVVAAATAYAADAPSSRTLRLRRVAGTVAEPLAAAGVAVAHGTTTGTVVILGETTGTAVAPAGLKAGMAATPGTRDGRW